VSDVIIQHLIINNDYLCSAEVNPRSRACDLPQRCSGSANHSRVLDYSVIILSDLVTEQFSNNTCPGIYLI